MAFQYMDLLYEVYHNAHTNIHSHGAIFHVQYSKVVFLAEIPDYTFSAGYCKRENIARFYYSRTHALEI
jgi:hypothetical protein